MMGTLTPLTRIYIESVEDSIRDSVLTDIAELRDAIAPGIFSAEVLQTAVKLLGGRKRTKRWKSTAGGVGGGRWGSHTSAGDVRRAMRHMARILEQLYGSVFGMATGVPAGGDPEDAFGLVAITDSATDDLTVERAFEALVIGFETFGRDCERYRTINGAPLPCLLTAIAEIRDDVVQDMQRAQISEELVDARFDALARARGLQPAVPGQKRDAQGQAVDDAGDEGTQDTPKGLSKAQKERARRKLRLQKRLTGVDGGAGSTTTGAGDARANPTGGTGGGGGGGGGGALVELLAS